MQEHVAVLQDAFHLRGVGDEVRAQVALVELHALDKLDLRIERLALLDGDHAVLAHLVHGLGDDLADLLILVGGAGAHLGDFRGGLDILGRRLELLDDGCHRPVDSALDLVGIGAGGDVLQPLGEDCLGEDGGGGGPVSGVLGRLAGDLLDHLGACILVGILQLDLLGDGHAVLGDGGGAEGFFKHHNSTRGAEGYPNRAGELANASQDHLTGFGVVGDLFGSHWSGSYLLVLGSTV